MYTSMEAPVQTKGLSTHVIQPIYDWAKLSTVERDAAYDEVFAQELKASVRPPKLNRLATLLGTTPQNLQHYLNDREARDAEATAKVSE